MKSIPTPEQKERSSTKSILEKRVFAKANDPGPSRKCYYESFEYLGPVKLKLPTNWDVAIKDFVHVIKKSCETVIPMYEVIIDRSLSYSVQALLWFLPLCHTLYDDYDRTMENITISNLVSITERMKLCTGMKILLSGVSPHVVQKVADPQNHFTMTNISQDVFYRAKECLVLLNGDICRNCTSKAKYGTKCEKRKQSIEPAALKALISATSAERIKLTLQMQRQENKELLVQVTQLQSA